MIGTVRKHSQLLWVVIIAAIIVSFLYWSPNVGRQGGGEGSHYEFGAINGKKITREQYSKAADEVRILAFFSNGKWIDRSDLNKTEWIREIYNRIALFEKMKELNVRPTEDATIQWIKNLLTRGANVDVGFDQFERVIKSNFEPQGVSLEQFEEFARHELGREHLQAVYGMGGAMITPAEATDMYRSENDDMHTEIANFSASNYLSQVKVTDAEVGKFYTNSMYRYNLPERVQVNYIKFPLTNYLAEADKKLVGATNLNQYLEQSYYKRTNEFKNMTHDDAIKKMREEVREQFALESAHKAAADVIQDLYKGHDDSNPLTPQELAKVATVKSLEVKESPLFDQNAATNKVGLPTTAIQSAFRLSNNDPSDTSRERLYTSTPIVGEDGAYILGLKQRVPSTPQPLSAVKDQVTQDYKQMEAAKLARDAGSEFGKYATNQIAKGKSFSSIASEKKVHVTKLPPFSLMSRTISGLDESIDPRQVKVVTMRLTPGKASDFVATQDGGFVIFYESRTPADPMKMQAELPRYMEEIRDRRQFAAYNEWFQKQVMDMRIDAPALRQETPAKPKS